MYPSKRPKVSEVHSWDVLYDDTVDANWIGQGGGRAVVSQAYPFPDFLKLEYWPLLGSKQTKYFYGEMAIHKCRNYLGDLGFRNAYYQVR